MPSSASATHLQLAPQEVSSWPRIAGALPDVSTWDASAIADFAFRCSFPSSPLALGTLDPERSPECMQISDTQRPPAHLTLISSDTQPCSGPCLPTQRTPKDFVNNPSVGNQYHPGVELRTNRRSISRRCHLFEVAFVCNLTDETIQLPPGCLQGGDPYGRPSEGT